MGTGMEVAEAASIGIGSVGMVSVLYVGIEISVGQRLSRAIVCGGRIGGAFHSFRAFITNESGISFALAGA